MTWEAALGLAQKFFGSVSWDRRVTSGPGVLTLAERRDDARADVMIEAAERAFIPCVMCDIGEPHACERAWWEQRNAHLRGRECADPECLCHPTTCDSCGQSLGGSRHAENL